MSLSIRSALVGLGLTAVSASAAAAGIVTVDLHGQGFSVRTAYGVSSLEVRVMGPQRTVLFEQRTEGAPIHWNLTGAGGDGDYRYEAVAVTGSGDQAQQHVKPGGFEVDGGQVVIPPAPAESEID